MCWMFLIFVHFLFFFFTPSVHPKKTNRQTCVRKSLICAFAMAFIISVMLIAANQMLRNGMEWPLALWARGSGAQKSHDLTFSRLCSQSWTDHNPDTPPNTQLSLSSDAIFSFLSVFYLFVFLLTFFCSCFKEPRGWWRSDWNTLVLSCKNSPVGVTWGKEECFYISSE